MSEDITGFSFPFRFGPSGGTAMTSGPDKLKENIKQILLTVIGERVMRRDYGGGMRELVHDPNNDALRSIVQHQIGKSISQWEPRVQVQDVRVAQREGELFVYILYAISRSRQQISLSVPIGLGGI